MQVNLLNYTPLSVADAAIGKCYDKGCHTDIDKMTKRIDNVANVKKHASTIEHISYNFDIDGVSRALLQELARHRIASYSVKSTRYTLKELKDGPSDLTKYLVMTPDQDVNKNNEQQLMLLVARLQQGVSNDIAKYMLPEAYKTSLVMTINARSLQNFIALRSDKHALWEIQDLAKAMYNALPEDHKFLFSNFLKVC
jgi:thymidylate synthase (FAD)